MSLSKSEFLQYDDSTELFSERSIDQNGMARNLPSLPKDSKDSIKQYIAKLESMASTEDEFINESKEKCEIYEEYNFTEASAEEIIKAWGFLYGIIKETYEKAEFCSRYASTIWEKYLNKNPGKLPNSLNSFLNGKDVIESRLKILRAGIQCLRDIIYNKETDIKLRSHVNKKHVFIYCKASKLFASKKKSTLKDCYVELRNYLYRMKIRQERDEAREEAANALHERDEAREEAANAFHERDAAREEAANALHERDAALEASVAAHKKVRDLEDSLKSLYKGVGFVGALADKMAEKVSKPVRDKIYDDLKKRDPEAEKCLFGAIFCPGMSKYRDIE